MQFVVGKENYLPIGPAVIETACTTSATQRLKCLDMRSRHPGGQPFA